MTESSAPVPSRWRRRAGFWLGLAGFAAVLVLPAPEGMPGAAKGTAATVLLMACWWIGEALPLGVTAMVPLVAYPMLGVMSSGKVAPNYMNHYVFLLLGGFLIALTMQRWRLHTRIALWIIARVGTGARRLLLGFMIASGFLSMWISNSATAMMMMPIGLGLIAKLEELERRRDPTRVRRFGACLMLGIAYAANVGGVGTLVGTFPNLVFAGMFHRHFPGAPEITFVEWLKFGFPFAACFIPFMWAYLVVLALPIRGRMIEQADEVLAREVAALGRMSRGEAMTLAVFVTTALLWIFRSDIVLGAVTIPGWAGLLGVDEYVHDATVGLAMGILCFILPADRERGVRLLDWDQAKELPWNILLLFGGGFAIAAGFEASGLTSWVGGQLGVLGGVPLPLVIAAVVLTMTFLTEFTSNTATTTMVLPILAATAHVLRLNPLLLMVPATVAASTAFMLPIGTPPNAIVFASGRVGMAEMARTGFFLNLITVLFTTTFVYVWLVPLFGIDVHAAPAWMR